MEGGREGGKKGMREGGKKGMREGGREEKCGTFMRLSAPRSTPANERVW